MRLIIVDIPCLPRGYLVNKYVYHHRSILIKSLNRNGNKFRKALYTRRFYSVLTQEGSILVTDSYKGYREKSAFENGLTHVRIPRGKHKSGSFNINTVKSYHSKLKRLINHYFKGLATKYLNNCIVYNNFCLILR